MSRTYKDSRAKYGKRGSASEKADRLAVIAVRRHPIDTKKLGQALLDLVTAQAEADAEADGLIQSSDSTHADNSEDQLDLDQSRNEGRQ